jgi:hypothetical protein
MSGGSFGNFFQKRFKFVLCFVEWPFDIMGNAISVNTQTYFFTSCMAKYTCITKPQVMAIRNILVSLATVTIDKSKRPETVKNGSRLKQENDDARNLEPLMMRRRHLYHALQKTNIVKEPDHEVLELLFTMWTNPEDEISKTQAPWYEFMISLSLLACKTDTLEQALRFALHVVSRNLSSDTGRMISASDAIAFLKGKVYHFSFTIVNNYIFSRTDTSFSKHIQVFV